MEIVNRKKKKEEKKSVIALLSYRGGRLEGEWKENVRRCRRRLSFSRPCFSKFFFSLFALCFVYVAVLLFCCCRVRNGKILSLLTD